MLKYFRESLQERKDQSVLVSSWLSVSSQRENESFFEDNDEDDEVDDGDDEDDERKKSGKKLEACRRPIPRDNVVPVLETSVLVRA